MNGRPPRAGYCCLEIQKKVSTIPRSLLLSSPNFKYHPCRCSKSIPLGPDPPKNFFTWPIWPHHMWCSQRNFCFLVCIQHRTEEKICVWMFPGQDRLTISLITTFLSKGCSIPRWETFPRGYHNYSFKGLNLRYIYCSQKHFYEKIEIY